MHSELITTRPIYRYIALAGLLTANASLLADSTHSHSEIHDMDPFVVNASIAPRSSRDMLNPATVVAGDNLEQSMAATLGAVLDGQPGVHSTSFGAGASRPVIRGLEGGRLRIMESGVESGDLSAESPDHAVAIEPFFTERIEVLRGASTLLYGSSAIGGVVNAIDKRIPRAFPEEGQNLQLMTDYNSASEGWTFAGLATVAFDEFVVSASYLDREHNDYSIPGYAEIEHEEHDHDDHEDDDHEEEEVFGSLENSFLESQIGSVAVSWFPSDQTRISLAFMATDSLYGVPGHAHGEHEDEHEEEHGHEDEDDHHDEEEEHHEDEHGHEEGVFIDMSQSTVDLEFEHRLSDSWIQSLEGRFRYVDYEHQEIEGDEVGTDFDRESWEARLTAAYLAGDNGPGAFGAQLVSLDSKAVGEESLTPESETNDSAAFILQEWHFDTYRLEAGVRAEHREIDAVGESGYSDWAYSGSFGSKMFLDDNWSAGLLFNHAQRHPSALELYADGPHAATRQFEIGDDSLGIETANGLDLSLHYQSEIVSASVTAFHTDFSDFIYANPTDEEEDGLRVYQFTQVDTSFTGLESELTWHAMHEGDNYFDVGFLVDWVNTDIKDSRNDLPRIPPIRAGVRMLYGFKNWRLSSSLRHSFKQDETALFEEESPAFTNWSASLLVDLPIENGVWHLIISGDNLLDEEIRPHTSPIKDVAPAPGRHFRVQLSASF